MRAILVLDANILIRAILGVRVKDWLLTEQNRVHFVTTAVALEEVREHLPAILKTRGVEAADFQDVLETLPALVEVLPAEIYRGALPEALLRLTKQDVDDAHLLALALTLACPIWSEDRDFFGVGVVTWRSGLIERFFAAL